MGGRVKKNQDELMQEFRDSCFQQIFDFFVIYAIIC
jgi:hypothetical protein